MQARAGGRGPVGSGAYDAAAVEGRISEAWMEAGIFRAPAPGGRSRFSIVMPPPNVTGRLHMGHALDCTLQDVFVRWHRMRGDATLWLPGTDHAGIATQAVVERRLREEGESRAALGREAFVRRVWAWKDEYEADIGRQLRRMGCSCDWSRQRFTLEPALARAVEEVFIRYHRDGLIYRGDYLVNWCPACGTAVSDLEVEHEPEPSRLYEVRYPLEGGGEVRVATARPETMLGDVAVAVHPDDPRHREHVGRTAMLPLSGRRIPVIADAAVDPEFGTGALKITPAHDATDAEIARRAGLPAVAVIGTDGKLTAEAGPRFAGLPVPEAREAVVAALRAEGLLSGEQPHMAPVGRCSRCGGVIEPLISRQWFVRMRPLADAAAAAVRSGSVRLVPSSPFTDVFLQWMDGAHDWCISRQLWWGHRIPAYECPSCGETVVAAEGPPACPRCGHPEMPRDPDVLDTWFSSALWPFATLGWPEDAADLRDYYPTDLLVTGRDIIFFWVARMVWSGLHATGEVPFRTVLLHGLVRDAECRKMSKSLGNGIDPLEVIDRGGADALRLTLLVGVAPGNDTRFLPEKLEGGQRFCNKLWNVARFVLAAEDDGTPPGPPELPDRHIRSRLEAARAAAEQALERLDAGEALAGLQAFVWDEFCDWYVEATKRRLYGKAGAASRAAARLALRDVLAGALRLLHPFLPFITEELWGQLGEPGLLAAARWPEPGARDEAAEAAFGLVQASVAAIRSLRAELRIPPAAELPALAHGPGAAALAEERETVCALARLRGLELRAPRRGEAGASAVVGGGLELYLPLEGVIDVPAEAARLGRELEGARREQERAAARLANAEFRARAKPEVVAREEARLGELGGAVRRLTERIASLSGRQELGGQNWNLAP